MNDSLKRLNEKYMRDTCLITHDPGGFRNDVWDPDAMEYIVTENDVTLYDGHCFVYQEGGEAQTQQGGETDRMSRYIVEIPVTAEVVNGAVVRITGVNPDGDPWLLDKTFVVHGQIYDSYATSRRVRVQRYAEVPR